MRAWRRAVRRELAWSGLLVHAWIVDRRIGHVCEAILRMWRRGGAMLRTEIRAHAPNVVP